MIAQGKAIVWHWDRNKAYDYDSNNYQKWKGYNVEQQGNIVEDWFDATKGNRSVIDPRFTYIEKVIRAGNPNAGDVPSIGTQVGVGAQVSAGKNGYDAAIFAVQELLIKRGYKIKADGYYGGQTINAIRDFQRRHGLKVDGFAGPKTLARLQGR